jgi:hypothetical protein
MTKTTNTEETVETTVPVVEENNSPMGSIEQIQTVFEAPRPVGEHIGRQKIKQIYLTNYSDENIGLWWDGKEYIYFARTKAPVSIGGTIENQNVRMKWALDLARREYYRDHAPATGVEGKSKLPRDAELEKYVQRALEDAPVSEPEFGAERIDTTKDYHVLKSPSAFPELSAQA